MRAVFLEGTLACGANYATLGRAHNGKAKIVEDGIARIGDDVVLVLKSHNLVGIFDGAGGGTDLGFPKKAALTAALAVRIFFNEGGDNLLDAMTFARESVIKNPDAGLCVGALARIITDRRTVDTVNAGDTAVLSYDPNSRYFGYLMEQQRRNGDSANFLGRRPPTIPNRVPDLAKIHPLNQIGSKIFLASDGALGKWHNDSQLEKQHFDLAFTGLPLLKEARRKNPNLVNNIIALLSGEAGRILLMRQMRDNMLTDGTTSVDSPVLLDPNIFDINNIDWAIWEEIILPYLEKLGIKAKEPTNRAILEELLNRTVNWGFQKLKPDDATIVMLDTSNI